MKQILHILAATVAVLLVSVSCAEKKQFEITGEIEGLGARTVTMLYYGSGGVQRVSLPADGTGRFRLQGHSPQPSMAVILLSDGTPLATVVCRNGDELSLSGSIEKPLDIKVKGNDVSSAISKWQADNALLLSGGDATAINSAVGEYISAHKSDMASTAILVSHFRVPGFETRADSLMRLIEPQARPGALVQNFSSVLATQLSARALDNIRPMILYLGNDTTYYYVPSSQSISVFAFVSENKASRDSIVPQLAALSEKYGKRRLGIVEINTAPDSLQWRNSIAADTALWVQSWAPGSVSAPAVRSLAVPRIPYFIVSDSTGAQLLRTHSVGAASEFVRARLH